MTRACAPGAGRRAPGAGRWAQANANANARRRAGRKGGGTCLTA